MERDNSKLLNEIKLALNKMGRDVSINKISCRDFITYYRVLYRYILLGANDYTPYAASLLNATVIVISSEEQYIHKKLTEKLSKLVVIDNNKKNTKR